MNLPVFRGIREIEVLRLGKGSETIQIVSRETKEEPGFLDLFAIGPLKMDENSEASAGAGRPAD